MKEQIWDVQQPGTTSLPERGTTSLPESVMRYLAEGLSRPDGKLPLFDEDGEPVNQQMVEEVLNTGLAEPAYRRQILKDWKILRITERGRKLVLSSAA